MKEFFRNSDVLCAKGRLIRSTEEISKSICQEIGFPLIIKPVDSFSSRGVFKINDFNEIANYESVTRNFSSNGDIILEEFMEGKEVSVESVTQNDVTTIVQITDKVITAYPTAVEMAHIQPSELNAETQDEVKALVKKAVKALGLNNCASHAEVKITKDGVKMVELGARLGGDYITSHLVPLSTGVNIEAAAIQIAMGKGPDLKHRFEKASMIQYLQLPQGKVIKRINDWNYLSSKDKIKQVHVFCKEGDLVPGITDSSKRSGCIIIQDSDRSSAIEYSEEITIEFSKCFVLS